MIIISLLIICFQVISISGHGRLVEPPSRNAMWRFGYGNPPNYDDNENYCGGFVVHYNKNGGKCGVCGDNYRDKPPRAHEAGGIYANGITSAVYVMGQVIEVVADLTTNHYGWFETKLCPHNNKYESPPQECFDNYRLPLADGSGYKYVIQHGSPKAGLFSWQVKLPEGVTANFATFQWTYFAGNTWNICPNGTGHVGCGNQETFINCADIAIVTNTNGLHNYLESHTFKSPITRVVDEEQAVYLTNRPGRRPYIYQHSNSIPRGGLSQDPAMRALCRNECLRNTIDCPHDKCKFISHCIPRDENQRNDADSQISCLQLCLSPNYLKNVKGCNEDLCSCW